MGYHYMNEYFVLLDNAIVNTDSKLKILSHV